MQRMLIEDLNSLKGQTVPKQVDPGGVTATAKNLRSTKKCMFASSVTFCHAEINATFCTVQEEIGASGQATFRAHVSAHVHDASHMLRSN